MNPESLLSILLLMGLCGLCALAVVLSDKYGEK